MRSIVFASLLFLLLGIPGDDALAAGALAHVTDPPTVAHYVPTNTTQGGQAVAWDSGNNRLVLATIRQPSPFQPALHLELLLDPSPHSYDRFTYSATFLNLQGADFEIPAIVPTATGYTVFVNRLTTSTGRWSSWAIGLTGSQLTVSWVRRLVEQGPIVYSEVRVREAVKTATGYAVVGALDNQAFGGKTFVAGLGTAGSLEWARWLRFDPEVELVSLTASPGGLIAGGWVSDLDSSSLQQPVLVRLSSSGSVLAARRYPGVFTSFSLPMIENGSGASFVAHWSTSSLAYVDVDASLNVSDARAVILFDGARNPVDAARTPAGTWLTVVEGAFGSASEILSFPPDPAVESPEMYDLNGVAGWDDVALSQVVTTSAGTLAVGGADIPGKTGRPLIAAGSENDGDYPSCVPGAPLTPRQVRSLNIQSAAVALERMTDPGLSSIPDNVALSGLTTVTKVISCG